MKSRLSSPKLLGLKFLAGAAAMALTLTGAVHAASATWAGADNGNWQTGSNWSTGNVPTNLDVATFSVAGPTIGIDFEAATNNGAGNQIVGQIQHSGGPNRTLGASSSTNGVLTIQGVNGILIQSNSGYNFTFAQSVASATGKMTLNFASAGTIKAGNGGTINLNTEMVAAGDLTFSTAAAGHIYANGGISGNAGIIIERTAGAGKVYIGGTNTYTGGTTVKSGEFVVQAGATFAPSNTFTMLGGTVSGAGTLTATSYAFTSGASTVSAALGGAGALNINTSASIATTVDLSGNNATYSGAMTVTQGRLRFSDTGLGAGSIIFNGEQANRYSNTAGTASIQQNTARNATIAAGQSVVINADKEGTFHTWGGYTITVDAAISGGGALRKQDGGTLILNGTNSYSGGTILTNGLLKLGTAGSLNSAGDFFIWQASSTAASTFDLNGKTQSVNNAVINSGTINNGTFNVNGTLTFETGTTTTNATINALGGTILAGGNTLNITAADSTISLGAVSGTGILTLGVVGNVTTTNVNNADGYLAWAAVTDGTGTRWGVNDGTGKIVALDASLYDNTGDWKPAKHTTVSTTNLSQLDGAATITLTFSEAAAHTVTLAGTGTLSGGQILVAASVGTFASVITGGTLKGSATDGLTINQANTANTLKIASAIADNGAPTTLTKLGSGTLVLGAENTFTGGMNIQGGAVNFGATGDGNGVTGTGNIGGAINIGDGASMLFAASGNSFATGTVSGITINKNATFHIYQHNGGSETVTWGLPTITINDGGTFRIETGNGNVTHNIAAAINTSGDVTLDSKGGFGTTINLSGKLTGDGQINYQVSKATNTGYDRTLTLSNAANAFTGDWSVDNTVNASVTTLSSGALNALGTGTVTLNRYSTLKTTIADGLNSLSGVILNQSTSSLNFYGAGFTSTTGSDNATGSISMASVASTVKDVTLNAGVINLSNAQAAITKITAAAGSVIQALPTGSTTSNRTFSGSTLGTLTVESGTIAGTIIDGSGTITTQAAATPVVITPTVALTKAGAAADTLILTGANTYTGGTIVNGGILQVGNGGTAGTLGTGAITVNTGGTLALKRSDTITTAETISGTGTIQNISGTAKFTGNASAFTGKLVGTAGTLAFANDAAPAATSLELAPGALLDVKKTDGTTANEIILTGTGTSFAGRTGTAATDIAGSLKIAAGHTLSVGAAAAVETLTVSTNLTLDDAVVKFTVADSSNYDKISVAALFAGATATQINVTAAGAVAGTLDLITLTTGNLTGFDIGKLTLTGNVGGTLLISGDNKKIQLQLGPDENTYTWKTGDGDWNTAVTNWRKADASPIAWPSGTAGLEKTGIFAGTAGTVALTENASAVRLQFNSDGYIIAGTATLTVGSEINVSGTNTATISAPMTGTALSKTGSGALIIAGTTTFTALTLGEGILQINDGGSLATATIANNATLAFNRTVALAASNVISGTGAVKTTGTGAVTLSGTNSYSGGTTVSKGSLLSANATAFGTGTVTLGTAETAGANAKISGDASTANITIANPITVADFAGNYAIGAVTTTRADATTTFSGAITLNRDVTLVSGAQDGTSFTGDITGAHIVYVENSATGTTFSGSNVKGHVGNRVILTGANTFSELIIKSGTLTNQTMLQINGIKEVIPDTANVTVQENAIFRLNKSEAINGLSGAGIVTGVVNARTITLGAGNGSGDFSGIMQNDTGDDGSLAVTKIGTGTQILSGANTYTGTTTVTAGILQIGNNATSGTLGTGATSVAATLAFSRSDTAYSYAGALTGTGKITNIGTGTVSLTNADGFTGTLAATAGTLRLQKDTAPAAIAKIEIASGATLSLKNTAGTGLTNLTLSNANTSFAGRTGTAGTDIDGSLTLSGGHQLNIGTTAGTENLTLAGTLALAGSATLQYTIGTVTGSNDNITADNFSATGTANSLALSFAGAAATGLYDLITLTNTAADAAAILTAGNFDFTGYSHRRASLQASTDNKTIQLSITATTLSLTWNGTAANAWNLDDTLTPWLRTDDLPSETPSEFANGDTVIFNGDRTSGDVTINAVVSPAAIIVNGAGDHVFKNSGTGKISGTATLTKTGTGKLTIDITTAAGVANDFTGSVTVSGGTLELTGTGALVANGGAASAIGASAKAAANLVLAGGTLRFNGSTGSTAKTDRSFTLGDGTSTIEAASIASNTIVYFSDTAAIAHTGTGARTLTLAGAGGAAAQNELTPDNASNGGILSLALTDASPTAPLSVVKNDTGTWVLTGTNTYTGKTTINAGLLSIASDAALGAVPASASFQADNITIAAGATLANLGAGNGTSSVIGAAPADVVLNANRGITITGTGNAQLRAWTRSFTIAGIITGTGGITKVDTGLLVLSGVNTFTGGVLVNAGTLRATVAGAIPFGAGTGGVTINQSGALEFTANSAINSLAGAGTVRNTADSDITLSVGLSGTGGDTTYAGVIANNATGSLALTKTGIGKLTLSGANTFTGNVNISEGTLVANSAGALAGTTSITIAADAALELAAASLTDAQTATIVGYGPISAPNLGAIVVTATTANIPKIVLQDASAIYTAGTTTLTSVTGTGNFSLSGGTGGAYILDGTGATIANDGDLELLGTTLTANATGSVAPTGSIYVSTGSNLVANADEAIALTAGENLALQGGALTVTGNHTQTLAALATDATSLITHDTDTATIGNVILDTTTGDITLNAKLGGTAGDGSNRLNLTKQGTGTLSINNADNNYAGSTTISAGTLELAVALDNGTAAGALGDGSTPATTAATQLVLGDGAILRSNAATKSATNKLFTVTGTTATIENSGAAALQFNGTGAIAAPASGFTLALDGSYAGDFNGENANILKPTLAGTNALVKNGAGTWVLAAANTYTGATTINNGTLALGINQAISASSPVTLGDGTNAGILALNGYTLTTGAITVSGDGTVINGNSVTAGALTMNIGANTQYFGKFGTAGVASDNNFAFTKSGAGKLEVFGESYYTGKTTVTGGTLAFANAAAPASTEFVLSAGATLDVQMPGNLTLGTGATLTAGSNGATNDISGNITLNGGTIIIAGVQNQPTDANNILKINGNLTVAAESSLQYNFTNSITGANSQLHVNNLSLTLANTLFVAGTQLTGSLQIGSYEIIKYANLVNGTSSIGGLVYTPIDLRYTIAFVDDAAAKTILMSVARKDAGNPLVWVGNIETAGKCNWGNPAAEGTNFIQEGAPVAYAPGDFATFDDSAQRFDVNVTTAGVTLGTVTFDNSEHDYTVSGGAITGEEDSLIIKTGTAKLTLLGANTYTGGTGLYEGTLALGNNAAIGTSLLQLDAGTLTTAGADIALANRISLTGTTTIEADANSLALSGNIIGSGRIIKTGANTLTLSGTGQDTDSAGVTRHFEGTVQVDNGTVAFGAPVDYSRIAVELTTSASSLAAAFLGDDIVKLGSLAGTAGTISAITSGAKTFEIGATGTTTTYAGNITDGTGTIGITKVGTGALTLAGNNSYTGETNVKAGLLEISGTLAATGIVNIDAGATFALTRDADETLTAQITNAGTFEKRGTGTLAVTGDNTAMAGLVRIQGGAIELADAGTLGTAIIDNNATLRMNLAGDSALANNMTGSGTLEKLGNTALTYTGDNTGTGETKILAGSIILAGSTAAKTQTYAASQITFSGGTALELATPEGATLYLNSALAMDAAAAPGATAVINKNDTGTVLLTGKVASNTNTGLALNINAGTLQIGDANINGELNAGIDLNIAAGSTLLVNRLGILTLGSKIVSNGTIQQLGGLLGTGTTVLTNAQNQIDGTLEIQGGILQVGDSAHQNATLNIGGNDLTVAISSGAKFVYACGGTSGENITFTGAGAFEKAGAGTVIFNSQYDNFTGAISVTNGTLVLTPDTIPDAGNAIKSTGGGTLELRNGITTPFALDSRFSGNGKFALAADNTVGTGNRTEFNYAGATNITGIIQVQDKVLFNLGTQPTTQINASKIDVLSGGLLKGQGRIAGEIFNAAGGRVEPGNSVGKMFSDFFTNQGTLQIEIEGLTSGSYDEVHYITGANMSGGTVEFVMSGALYNTLRTSTASIEFLINDSAGAVTPETTGSKNVFIVDGVELAVNPVVHATGTGGILYFTNNIFDTPELKGKLRDGLGDYQRYLNNIFQDANDTSGTFAVVEALYNSADPVSAFNNASPLGLASMTAMAVTAAHDDAGKRREHLESLRYEVGQFGRALDWAAYVQASGLMVDNGDGRKNPAFDFNTYGGNVGLDKSLGERAILGISLGYHSGKATIKDSGGKVKQDGGALSIYGTYMITDYVYADLGVFAGYDSYDVEHDTPLGRATAKPDGCNAGGNAYLGGILPITQQFHFTPYAGLEYVYADVDGFSETGSDAALKVDGFSQNSLMAKVGTGINWIVPTGKEYFFRLGLDIAYGYEILDDETDISARFAGDTTGAGFNAKARTTARQSVQVGPSAEFRFDENKTIGLNYTFEYDFESQYIHHINAEFRMRF